MCSIPGRSSQLKARSAHHRCITRDDGAAGPAAIDRRGDTSLVQDLDDALYPAMPRNALQLVPCATAHPAAGLGAAIAAAVARPLSPAPDTPTVPDTPVAESHDPLLREQVSGAATDLPTTDRMHGARPSPFSCPDCHGVLFELPGGPSPRFRCRVGHAWSPASLEEDQAGAVEKALWAALRALEEKAALVERLAGEARRHGHLRSADIHDTRSAHTREQADRVRELLHRELGPLVAQDAS